MRNVLAGKVLAVALVFVVAVGLAFYGGMVYQNHIDQPLFSQYTPSQTGGGRAGGGAGASFFGGFSSGGSQTAAALAYATPPSSNSTGTVTGSPNTGNGAAGGAGGAGGSGGAATGTPTSGAQRGAKGGNGGSSAGAGGAAGGGAAGNGGNAGAGNGAGGSVTPVSSSTGADVEGTLVSNAGGALILTDATGAKQTIATSASTQYYQVKVVPASTLAVGQQVSMALQRGDQGFSVGSITIAPSGSLYGFVKPYPAVSGGGFGFAPSGKVTAVASGTVTVTTSSGRAMPLTLSSSTTVYQLVPVTSLSSGALVSAHEATSGGKTVAANVVESSIKGNIASLTTPPARRAGGFGGGGGGYSGGNGGGYGGGNGGGGGPGQ